MKTLFIDTNIFLSFYHLTAEDLEELRKIIALIDSKQIRLMITEHVKNEFLRNRGSKIADAMRRLQDAKFNVSFPAFAKSYTQYAELRELLKKADNKHAELIAVINDDAACSALDADELIEELFAKSTIIKTTENLQIKALWRVRQGNPPGKENSLGDAINWEGLLETVQNGTNLYLVSGDKDFRSSLVTEEFNEFLENEWEEKKKSYVNFYSKISAFFKDNFPNIKIASEIENDLLIQKLAESRSFANTHLVIGELVKQNDFSTAQVEMLVEIARTNNQVSWVIADTDVHEFYSALHKKYADNIQTDAANELAELVKAGEPEEGPAESG